MNSAPEYPHAHRIRPQFGSFPNIAVFTRFEFATAFAAAGRGLDSCLLSEMIFTLGKVPLAAYGTPGTTDIYRDLLHLLPDYDAFLLANHGVVTVGKSLLAAYHKLETVEHSANIVYLAEQLGGGKPLTEKQVRELVALKQKAGISTKTDCLTDINSTICDAQISESALSDLADEIAEEVTKRIKNDTFPKHNHQ